MNNKPKIGMIGLGTMGRNLALNIAEHGFAVAGYDIDAAKVTQLETTAKESNFATKVAAFADLQAFVGALEKPRAVMMLVPAGKPVDAVIQSLLPLLESGDIIIDGGNSYFHDTEHRQKQLAKEGIYLLGMGVSGGEEGARHGPSMMPGGDAQAYQRVQPIFEAVSAQVEGMPCVAYMGPQASGHYVKMVHNGIEYGLMQLIAESYHLLKVGCRMDDEELHKLYHEWNQHELNSFLIEITSEVFALIDKSTSKPLIDLILGEAGQKGTGMWTSQEAMNLGIAVPTIDLAVAARNMTVDSAVHAQARAKYGETRSNTPMDVPIDAPIEHVATFKKSLKQALQAAFILTYAQGFALLHQASKNYKYQLDPEAIARIWRGGCIIRSQMLEDFRHAFQKESTLANLMLDPALIKIIKSSEHALRTVVQQAMALGIPVPALSATVSYFDTYRAQWLPANLIQAQRDFFGAHTYQRIDRDGTFHSEWESIHTDASRESQ